MYAFGLQIYSTNAFNAFRPLSVFSIFFLYDTWLRYIFGRTYFCESDFDACGFIFASKRFRKKCPNKVVKFWLTTYNNILYIMLFFTNAFSENSHWQVFWEQPYLILRLKI